MRRMDFFQLSNSGIYQKPERDLMNCWTIFYSDIKIFSNNPEFTYDATSFGIVIMMKAIINLQKTILSCPEGIFDKDSFIDNTLMNFRTMSKEERDLTLMMELKRILWEVQVPSEYIKSLFQEE